MSLSNFEHAQTEAKSIPAESLAKTSFGIVASLSDLFEEFMYHPSRILPNNGGSTSDNGPGWFFISSEHKDIETWERLPCKRSAGLYVKPVESVRKAIEARCFARSMGAPHGVIGGFKIIPWANTGHALIVASDEVHICNPFVAFVPLAALPVINSTDTPVRGKGGAQ